MEHEATKTHEAGEARRLRRTRGLSPPPTPFVHFVLRSLRNLRRLREPVIDRRVLRAMLDGATLKAHRTLNGEKTYTLHPLDGPDETVDRAAVETLKRHGLVASNMKFPAATYVLTEKGLAWLTEFQENRSSEV